MKIELHNVGRRFNYEWIFRNLTCTFEKNKIYAVIGKNGSGKSTLLQILSAVLSPSEGEINFFENSQIKVEGDFFKYVAWCAPAIELIEQYTLSEFLVFQSRLKPFSNQYSISDIMDVLELSHAKNKPLNQFSSGMKQRVKLGQALFSNSPILLLDEPTVNLDTNGISWYKEQLLLNAINKIVIIASNQTYEYDFCNTKIEIENYKRKKP